MCQRGSVYRIITPTAEWSHDPASLRGGSLEQSLYTYCSGCGPSQRLFVPVALCSALFFPRDPLPSSCVYLYIYSSSSPSDAVLLLIYIYIYIPPPPPYARRRCRNTLVRLCYARLSLSNIRYIHRRREGARASYVVACYIGTYLRTHSLSVCIRSRILAQCAYMIHVAYLARERIYIQWAAEQSRECVSLIDGTRAQHNEREEQTIRIFSLPTSVADRVLYTLYMYIYTEIS